MLDSWIEEFLTVTKYMNISRAAQELHMTQPNLSRHIKQMESEIGFRLFVQKGSHIVLTSAGIEYAENLTEIMSSYRELTKRCSTISDKVSKPLIAQMAPYPDEAGSCYFRLLNGVINKDDLYEFEFVSESRSRKNFKHSVLEQEIDMAVVYSCEKPDIAIPQFAEEGLSAFFLSRVPLGVWLPVKHEFSHESKLSVEQLARITILFPNNPSSPLKPAYLDILAKSNYPPNYKEIHVGSRLSFIFHQSLDLSYLFPYSMKNDFTLSWQDKRVMIPLDECVEVFVYAIAAEASNLF